LYFSDASGILFILGRFSDKEDKDGKNKRRLLINSLGFVLGFTIVFTLLGAAATSLGAFLRTQRCFENHKWYCDNHFWA